MHKNAHFGIAQSSNLKKFEFDDTKLYTVNKYKAIIGIL